MYASQTSVPPRLTKEEELELRHQFGWSAEGPSESDAKYKILPMTQAIAFGLDKYKGDNMAMFPNVPGCEPGVNYVAGSNPHNDCRDALRHAVNGALWGRRNPHNALLALDAHERSVRNPFKELRMDLGSNHTGVDVGDRNRNATPDEIFRAVARKLEQGTLISNILDVPDVGENVRRNVPPRRIDGNPHQVKRWTLNDL